MASPAPKLAGLAMEKADVPEDSSALSKEELISLVNGLSSERDDLQAACRALARQQSSDALSTPRAKEEAPKKRVRKGPNPGPCASWWGEGATKTEEKAVAKKVEGSLP